MERQFIVHAVLHQNCISLFYPNECNVGKVRIVLRHIRVSLFDQFPEAGMYPVQARPAGNAKHFSSFGNGYGRVRCHQETVGEPQSK